MTHPDSGVSGAGTPTGVVDSQDCLYCSGVKMLKYDERLVLTLEEKLDVEKVKAQVLAMPKSFKTLSVSFMHRETVYSPSEWGLVLAQILALAGFTIFCASLPENNHVNFSKGMDLARNVYGKVSKSISTATPLVPNLADIVTKYAGIFSPAKLIAQEIGPPDEKAKRCVIL